MLTPDYLARGLLAMSNTDRAHDLGGPPWVSGHVGAAMIAAWHFQQENALAGPVAAALRREIDELAASKPQYFQAPAAGSPANLDAIPAALESVVANPYSEGHHTIYAMLAIKALRASPGVPDPALVGGVVRLIEMFRAFAPPPHTVEVSDAIPELPTSQALLEFTLGEFVAMEEFYYGWQGGPGHLLTHAQSLIELEAMGYGDLARTGRTAFRGHAKAVRLRYRELRTTRRAPVAAAAEHPPTDAAFWNGDIERDVWAAGHVFKYPYTLHNLIARTGDERLKREALRQLRFLLTRRPVADGPSVGIGNVEAG